MARKSNKSTEEQAAAAAEKAERFRKVATGRVGKALDAIETIGNCANKNTYTWTDEQLSKIEAALRAKVDATMKLFRTEGGAAAAAIDL